MPGKCSASRARTRRRSDDERHSDQTGGACGRRKAPRGPDAALTGAGRHACGQPGRHPAPRLSDSPAFFALVASRQGDGRTLGVLLASPVFSTTRGGAGLYVSDLWVAGEARGASLGERLLAAAPDHAPKSWTVTFLKLAVYQDNPRARGFYERLGFRPREGETVFDLEEPELQNLRKRS
ncbi:GNAT family N-acetyltransferase [Roseibium salinum]|uniref:GNAT family N-acetyltransferase n=1 Tax=Roseibium salinum TaxID=1604349 RepID=UPI003605B08F